MAEGQRSLARALGPGIVFAATAVGVSHLVQSTRAGAGWGLGLALVVLLANAVKYPAFRFGTEYALATGTTLFEGFRRQGRWALALYLALTLATMFTVLAVVSVVTAGLFVALSGTSAGAGPVAVGLIAIGSVLVAVGGYRWLDRASKAIVVVLTVSTVIAAAVAAPHVDWSTLAIVPAGLDARGVAFVVGLVGWMPSAIDVAAWQSAWTIERARETGGALPPRRDVMLDFHVGYVGTALLALAFLVLGAGAMHGRGETLAGPPGAFAAQVVELYGRALGGWARPIVGAAALATMLSTTLTVIDGFPRALASLVTAWRDEGAGASAGEGDPRWARRYRGAIVVLALGASGVLLAQSWALTRLVDLATTASFLTAPLLAWLGHRAMHAAEVPEAARPRAWLTRTSLVCIALQAAFAIYYLAITYGPA